MWQSFLQIIVNALSWVLNLLPNSPFQALDTSPIKPYLATINWIVPVDFAVSTMELWLAAILVYYAYSAILRIVRAIS